MEAKDIITHYTLLEKFVLDSKATHAEHVKALESLSALAQAAQKSIEDQDQQS